MLFDLSAKDIGQLGEAISVACCVSDAAILSVCIDSMFAIAEEKATVCKIITVMISQ